MNYAYIEQLIARYWEAETSQEEEQILRSFFAQKEVPAHLQQYAAYFAGLGEASEQGLGSDFDERLLARIGAEEPKAVRVVKARPLTLTDRVRPYFRAAAAVAIVAVLAGSVDRAITRNAHLREARLAAQTTQTDSITTQMETLRDIFSTPTAAADSAEATPLPAETTLHY